MCGRFSLKASPDDLERVFGTPPPPGYHPRYNVAPMQEVLAVVAEDGRPQPRLLRWGLVPFWADDPAIGNRMINARAETVQEKPAFRNAFARRRCLVLADGFYEWARRADGKHPMRIQPRSREPIAFAGLWERWGKGARPIDSCTILTRGADSFMLSIHDRMPVILGAAERERWLDPDASPAELSELMQAPAPELEAYEVSTLVNNPANDVAGCLDPLPLA